MSYYKLKIKFNSSFITPLESDTLFGHICWAFRFLKGKEFLEKFLSEFEEEPKFLISDGFISETLPRPVLKELNYDEYLKVLEDKKIRELFEISDNFSKKSMVLKVISEAKKIKNTKLIPKNIFIKLQNNFNFQNVLLELLKNKDEKKEGNFISAEVVHNSIDRTSGSVLKGFLYTQVENYYSQNTTFDIYFNIFDKNYIDLISQAFEYIEISGYGKDKSTGKGHISIIEPLKMINDFDEFKGDYVVSLSSFIMSGAGKKNMVFYDLKTKFGKVYLNIDEESSGNFNPFKKPLLMFDTGSVIDVSGLKNEELIFGELIKDINKDMRVRHYSFCFPIRINIS